MKKTLSLVSTLKTYFGYSRFREFQEEICEAILSGRDCLAVMSTGFGKSLLYQLPAIHLNECGMKCCAIVISPLISLIEDQMAQLKNLGVSVGCIGGTSKVGDEDRARRGEFTILFSTPEKICVWKDGLLELANCSKIVCLAIDESHCVSEWGHDFRPHYRNLSEIRSWADSKQRFPILALTATATAAIQADILINLQLINPMIAKTSFDRKNLKYFVCNRSGVGDLVRVLVLNRQLTIKTNNNNVSYNTNGVKLPSKLKIFQSTLIYVNTKKEAEELSLLLRSSIALQTEKGVTVTAAFYHAGMSHADRQSVHFGFCRDEIEFVVATIAFGMGIHKPDIRTVINYGMPKSMESYVQQCGRAGRDGLPATCILLYNRNDASRCFNIAQMGNASSSSSSSDHHSRTVTEQLNCMSDYCKLTNSCRRQYMLRYFGEYSGSDAQQREDISQKCCDLCDVRFNLNSETNGIPMNKPLQQDLSKEAAILLSVVKATGEHCGLGIPISIIMGRHEKTTMQRYPNYSSIPQFGTGAYRSSEWWKSFAHHIVDHEALLQTVLMRTAGGPGRSFAYEKYQLTDKGRLFLMKPDNERVLLVTPPASLQALAGTTVVRSSVVISATQSSASSSVVSHLESTNYDEDTIDPMSTALLADLGVALRELRGVVAGQFGTNPYNILSSLDLENLIEAHPVEINHLRYLSGWGEWKILKFGEIFVSSIVDFLKSRQLEVFTNPRFIPAELAPIDTQIAPATHNAITHGNIQNHNHQGQQHLVASQLAPQNSDVINSVTAVRRVRLHVPQYTNHGVLVKSEQSCGSAGSSVVGVRGAGCAVLPDSETHLSFTPSFLATSGGALNSCDNGRPISFEELERLLDNPPNNINSFSVGPNVRAEPVVINKCIDIKVEKLSGANENQVNESLVTNHASSDGVNNNSSSSSNSSSGSNSSMSAGVKAMKRRHSSLPTAYKQINLKSQLARSISVPISHT